MRKKHILLLAVVLGIDQITKFVVDGGMALNQQIPVIPGFFNFTYLHNTGAAWSMLEGKMWFFYVITVIALIAMFLFYRGGEEKDELTKVALVLMMAGTIGNFIDRLCFQYVRDFIDFIIFGYNFPVFNVADMALCIGVFLIIADVFLDSCGMVRRK